MPHATCRSPKLISPGYQPYLGLRRRKGHWDSRVQVLVVPWSGLAWSQLMTPVPCVPAAAEVEFELGSRAESVSVKMEIIIESECDNNDWRGRKLLERGVFGLERVRVWEGVWGASATSKPPPTWQTTLLRCATNQQVKGGTWQMQDNWEGTNKVKAEWLMMTRRRSAFQKSSRYFRRSF